MYRAKKVFVIAIDGYSSVHCQPLDNPVADGRRLTKVLQERYGFAIARDPLFNEDATRENIEEALFAIAAESYEEDVLVIFFAGHGGQEDVRKTGFWYTIDAQDPAKKQKLLWNSGILQAMALMKFKHILLISDSCYSGTFITRTPALPQPSSLEEADALESRWVFVSGGEETVKDGHAGKGSPFMSSICKFLETNKKARFPATELFSSVKSDFSSPEAQSPDAAPLSGVGHNGGILLFETTDPTLEEKAGELTTAFPLPPGPPLGPYIERTLSPKDANQRITSFFGLETDRKKITDLIEYENRFVVLGNAGSGKSRELLRLRERLNESGGRFLPVYKRFNTYVDQQISHFLPKGWEDVDPYMAVFLLDGLDEVQPQYFGNAVRSLEDFVTNHPHSKFIITCRNNFYELPERNFSGTLNSFSVYELNDISLLDIKKYVTDVKGLDGSLFLIEAQRHRLLDLVQKPFFLEILLQYFQEHGNLTHKRSAIIEGALMAQLASNRQRLNSTEHGRILDNDTALGMLQKIGFIMEQMGRNYLSDQELRALFPIYEDRELVKELPTFFHDDEQHRWQFEHNNTQEYLAASVLRQLPFDNVLKLITIPGTNAIKPSWTNTLSFFISIGEDNIVMALLTWLVQHQSAFIFRLEAERIPEEIRIQVALEIIQSYAKENIWISSTLFTEEDIARIGAFPDVIHHLQRDLDSPDTTITVKMNAFRILRYMNYDRFPTEKKTFNDSLLLLVRKEDTPNHLKYSALNTLGSLQMLNPDEINSLVIQYKNNINAYIRAGLYSLIITTKHIDDYVDIFLDGLDINTITTPTGTRSSVTLMNESIRLVDGLAGIATADSAIKVLKRFGKPGSWRHLSRDDNKAILENIVNIAIVSYQTQSTIFNELLNATIESAKTFDHDNCVRLSRFFTATGTAYEAILQVLSQSTDFVSGELLALLLEPSTIQYIMDQYLNDLLTEAQIRQIHAALIWHKRSYGKEGDLLDEFEDAFQKSSGIHLKQPSVPAWPQIPKKDPQANVNLLFNRTRFKEGVTSYYRRIGKNAISWDEVVTSRAKHRDDFSADSPVFTFFSDYFHSQISYDQEETLRSVDTPAFDNWAMQQVYRILEESSDSSVTINAEQQERISEWVLRTLDNRDLGRAIACSDGIVRVLWHFILKFHIDAPTEKLLPFTLYYDFKVKVNLGDIGTIDELEKLVSKETLFETITANLLTKSLPALQWLNNASYAIKHRLSQTYPLITEYLVATPDFDYKYQELLELWAAKEEVANIDTVAKTAVNISIRLSALSVMAKASKQNSVTASILAGIVDDTSVELIHRLEAAKQLIRLNDARGVAFIAQQIENSSSKAGHHNFELIHSIARIKSLDALPYLLQLIAVALRPAIRSQDEIGYFFSQLLDGLFNIGIQSKEALDQVTTKVTAFIVENENTLVDLEVLKVNLRRLHEQFHAAHVQPMTLLEAVARYEEIR
ncbi:caspase family protein [Puia sp. P3]|uniref:caspase family protein n=1 Tax=Puia sp. P3 TaxID=3423952 RepID=UPI003D66F454